MFFFRWKVTWEVLTLRSYNYEKNVFSTPLRSLSFRIAYLDIHLVTAENNGNVLADTFEITVPVRDVLVGDTRGDIEHDDTALALDVVAITETTELLLTSGIPYIEANGTEVGGEGERVDLNTKGSCSHTTSVSAPQDGPSVSQRKDVPMYFFSNSPVKWRYRQGCISTRSAKIEAQTTRRTLTKVVFPVPPSPTVVHHRVQIAIQAEFMRMVKAKRREFDA